MHAPPKACHNMTSSRLYAGKKFSTATRECRDITHRRKLVLTMVFSQPAPTQCFSTDPDFMRRLCLNSCWLRCACKFLISSFNCSTTSALYLYLSHENAEARVERCMHGKMWLSQATSHDLSSASVQEGHSWDGREYVSRCTAMQHISGNNQTHVRYSYRKAFLRSRSFHDSIIYFILCCHLCNIACTLETIASAEQLLFKDCSLLGRQSCPAYCHQQCVSRWTQLPEEEKQNDNREIRRRHYANRRSKS